MEGGGTSAESETPPENTGTAGVGHLPEQAQMRKKVKGINAPLQLQIFESLDPYTVKIKEELKALDLNTMTPMDALWKLNELKKIADK